MPTPDKRNELRAGTDGRTTHDVGGLDFGPIDMHEHDLALWEKRVDAMLVLLATKKQAFKIDAMRRVIESYGEQEYDATEYYEKWVRAIRNLIVEQELVSKDEIEARIAKVAEDFKTNGRDVAASSVPWDDIGTASKGAAS
ncbi:MAG: ScnB-like protein [Pseudomonadota bacterium]